MSDQREHNAAWVGWWRRQDGWWERRAGGATEADALTALPDRMAAEGLSGGMVVLPAGERPWGRGAAGSPTGA